MPERAHAHVREQDKVRLYDEHHEWFDSGVVQAIDWRGATVDVDYGDWVQRYALDQLQVCYPEDGSYERCLIPTDPGTTIADYRDEDEQTFA